MMRAGAGHAADVVPAVPRQHANMPVWWNCGDACVMYSTIEPKYCQCAQGSPTVSQAAATCVLRSRTHVPHPLGLGHMQVVLAGLDCTAHLTEPMA